MDLRNVLKHKRCTTVYVNGTVYEINTDGIVQDVPDADAAKLLQNAKVWRSCSGKKPTPVPLTVDPTDGESVTVKVKAKADTLPPAEDLEPTGDPELPEPTEDMDIEELRRMADTYEVTYDGRTGKKKLVKLISEEMFED